MRYQKVPDTFLWYSIAVDQGISSLYVHFPFCETKCHYCDFYSLGRDKTSAELPALFQLALKKECALAAERFAEELAPKLETIFFGGGTPSMTSPQAMADALAPLKLSDRIHAGTEWTMEANPSSVTLESLRGYKEFGVNRISMGVQALRDDLLASLGRVHSREAALKALENIFEAGFRNVSVDLLCGVPGQSLDDVESAMEKLTSFPITHLSCYLLTLPKGHRMYSSLPDDEMQLKHLLLIDEFMKSKGFEHYEISNFAKPGMRARHNLAYWKNESYLGLGPSAHSHSQSRAARWKNISSLHRYGEKLLKENTLPIEWEENVSAEQSDLENWMLALRLSEGFPSAWLDTKLKRERAREFQSMDLLEPHPDNASNLRLTPKGFALSDQVISALA